MKRIFKCLVTCCTASSLIACSSNVGVSLLETSWDNTTETAVFSEVSEHGLLPSTFYLEAFGGLLTIPNNYYVSGFEDDRLHLSTYVFSAMKNPLPGVHGSRITFAKLSEKNPDTESMLRTIELNADKFQTCFGLDIMLNHVSREGEVQTLAAATIVKDEHYLFISSLENHNSWRQMFSLFEQEYNDYSCLSNIEIQTIEIPALSTD